MKCVEVYKELYHQEPFDVAFCPYRISPLGAHIDHQYGKINGLAIDKGIHMAYHPKQNGVVELQSLNFPKRAQFFVNAVPEEKQGDWADHLRGAAKMLGEKYRLKVGLSGIIEGSLPIGGLSSSASVIICFLSALCKVNGIHLEPMEMILTAKAAENQYVGVACGKLDQSCEVLSKKNHLLYLDTKDDSYELIPTSEKMKPYKVAIFFSGLERSLKNSKYNLRQDECKAAAYALTGAGRYQLLPFCHQCKTTAHPAVSHGGRQPLQGRVSARGDQSPYRGCDFRREYVLFRIRPEVSGGYGSAQGAYLPDRFSYGRGAAHESGEDSEKRCVGASGAGKG